MLALPVLHNQDFESIVEDAVSRLALYGDTWKPTGEHEAGQTFLELFAFLKEQQQKQIDIIGSKSLYKFLPMLGLSKAYAEAAGAMVVFDGEGHIPRGTKLLAGNLVFETMERLSVVDTVIKFLGEEGHPEAPIKYIDYASLESGQAPRRVFENKKPLYIGFSKALPQNNEIQLYVAIYDGYEIKRNPITDIDRFIRLAKLEYEYFGSKEGITGWHPLRVLTDETIEFLYSGSIRFALDGTHACKDGVFPIRIKPVQYDYEVPPSITGMYVNAVSVKQQDTKCEALYFTYADFKQNKMYFDSFLAFDGFYDLYINHGNGWQPANALDIKFLVKPAGNHLFRLGTSGRDTLNGWFEGMEEKDNVLMLVVYETGFYSERLLGSSAGKANQIYYLPKKYENILYDSFDILCGRRDTGQIVWEKVESLDASRPGDRHYILNPQTTGIRFGDNERGKVPPLGATNVITVISLKTTMAESGNIKAGAINRFFPGKLFEGMRFKQLTAATGGKAQETDAEAIARLKYVFGHNRERAVTVKDYENIILSAQGLMISGVTVIPSEKENEIMVVVESFGSGFANHVPQSYMDNVTKILNKAKLITTQIKVCGPRYVGLDVYGEIIVHNGYQNAEQSIENCLKRFIEEFQKNKRSKSIYNIELCGVLEQLPCVKAVKYIDWGTQPLSGSQGRRRDLSGDLAFMPYEKVYLHANNILLIVN